MAGKRPKIPAELQRLLMIESSYRCAICKGIEPLDIDHIVEWSKVKKHEFSNMIVLCKNCHGRKKKTSDPRHINRASLKKIKSDLMMLNGRYSDLERRIIDEFRQKLAANPCNLPSKEIPELLSILVQMMVLDGIVTTVTYLNGTIHRAPNGTEFRNNWLELTLTEKGRRFIDKLAT